MSILLIEIGIICLYLYRGFFLTNNFKVTYSSNGKEKHSFQKNCIFLGAFSEKHHKSFTGVENKLLRSAHSMGTV